MPLQTGTWTASVSGNQATFQISFVDALGNVTVTGPGLFSAVSQGFWDEDAQKLMLFSSSGAPLFVGYLFTDTVNLTGVTGSVIFTLAGEVEFFEQGGIALAAKRSTFGWYAQIGVD